MAWNSLGTVGLTSFEPATFEIPDFNGELFRLTQSYPELDLIWGWAIFAWNFPNQGRFGHRRVYMDQENGLIFYSPIPPQFLAAGIATRYGVIRIGKHTKAFGFNWQFTLEVWQ